MSYQRIVTKHSVVQDINFGAESRNVPLTSGANPLDRNKTTCKHKGSL